jgi:hypothetical protein
MFERNDMKKIAKKSVKKAAKNPVKKVTKKVTEQTEERPAQDCYVEHVRYVPTYDQYGNQTAYVVNVFKATSGQYKGEYVVVLSRLLEQTPSCKTVEGAIAEATQKANVKYVIDGIKSR